MFLSLRSTSMQYIKGWACQKRFLGSLTGGSVNKKIKQGISRRVGNMCNPQLRWNPALGFYEWLKNIYSSKTNMVKHRNNKRAMMALGRSPEYHWDQIISKSVHRFSRRSSLKLFSIYSPGGHFVQQRGTV